ncbi:hypothetical protein [Mycobacterium spongiae]|nr:hypothetical protein [Mycobacterium spongiae]
MGGGQAEVAPSKVLYSEKGGVEAAVNAGNELGERLVIASR